MSLRYINNTSNFGLCNPKDSNSHLVGYTEDDWAEDMDDRKSTSEGCFYMGNNLISWLSKKQNSISLYTVEANQIIASVAVHNYPG